MTYLIERQAREGVRDMDFSSKLVQNRLSGQRIRFAVGLDPVEIEALRRAGKKHPPSSAGDLIRFLLREMLEQEGHLTDELYEFYEKGGRFATAGEERPKRPRRGGASRG
jgi:hypothetical protein